MASGDGIPGTAVEFFERMGREPYRYGFLATVRRLDCLHPESPPTGLAVRPRDEPFRLGQYPALDFAPAEMHSCEQTAYQERWRLRFRFFGLYGPNGPLPLHLTETARERSRQVKDQTSIEFADIFHHRLMSLFYRAWAFGEPTVHFDRPETDRFTAYVGALAGIVTDAFQKRDAIGDPVRLHFAGRFAGQARHAEGLEAMLADFFDMPCRIEQFVGHWMWLPTDSVTRLGESPRSATLGESALCGSRVWDTQSKFRILFGPLDFEQFCRLLPGRDTLHSLIALVRAYLGDELLWDIQLKLRRDSIPQTRLGQQGQLGWTSFLVSDRPAGDSDAAVFTPEY